MNTIITSPIVSLCGLLPDDFFRKFLPPQARKPKPLLLGDKVTWAENEPAFTGTLPGYYFEAKAVYACRLVPAGAFRAYLYLKNGGRIPDQDLAIAYARTTAPDPARPAARFFIDQGHVGAKSHLGCA